MNKDLEVKRCVCGYLQILAKDINSPVRYDALLDEYSIASVDNRFFCRMYYCFSCGGWVSESRRDLLFTNPDEMEVTKALQSIANAKTIDDVIGILGPPDYRAVLECESEGKYGSSEIRYLLQHGYSKLWKTFNLEIFEREDKNVDCTVVGKRKSDGSSGVKCERLGF